MTEVRTASEILEERNTTHGDFGKNAEISQSLKRLMNQSQTYDTKLSDVQQEALDMIALKLSRILSGQANFKDHWDDIAGYATLASRAIP